MLSYQHIYHAGNLADVHKHALLCRALEYMTRKDKPLSYIETHAGRGLYRLDAPEALKTGEAARGILALEQGFATDHPYRQRLAEVRARYGDAAYPGSPLLAALSLRDADTLHLAELHPQEYRALTDTMRPWGAHVHQTDGLALALALCPPTPRRGLMLIDPSYEVKDDYATIPKAIMAMHRKWNVGVICLWYPILTTAPHEPMLDMLAQAFADAMRHELRFAPAREDHGLVGSGMFIVNPPYGIADEAERLTRIFNGLG
ncbi:MAG: 23S rRNA (adenine(2030)-N(6))-methyltransferase RlmJ [Pseudorhodobacter sp.]|nr:23S rRNA (adenine(2030)-N(6))-methyltransferase RlmJ [Pseudorhodobacter sp.]